MSLNSDILESEARSKALLEASRENNAQVATALQSARGAISAYQTAQTAEFRRVAEQSEQARPPLGSAIEAAQSARTVEFNRLAEQGKAK